MITTGAWQPVIERSSALGARAASLLDSITSEAAANSGLDTALLLSYRAVAERNASWMKRAVEQLNSAIAEADALYSTRRFELFSGLAGLGWVIEHVTRQLNRFRGSPEGGERAAKLLNEAIDVALLLELQRGRWKGTGDLVSGLAGIGVYFLQGLPDPTSKFGLELVLAHLDDATKSAPPCNGLGGVAAGAAGMLYLAAEAAAAGVATLQAGRLVAACEAAILHHQIESQGSCCWWSDELAIAAVCMQRQPHSAEISHWTKRVLRECLERTC